jgi:hypothetical protein
MFGGVQSFCIFIVIVKPIWCVLDHLHGTSDLNMFTSGKLTPKVKITTFILTTINLFANLVINSYGKSCTHNSHNVFIYNTLFLDPKLFIPLIGFDFIGLCFIRSLFTKHVSNLWLSPNTTSQLHCIFYTPMGVVDIAKCIWQIQKHVNKLALVSLDRTFNYESYTNQQTKFVSQIACSQIRLEKRMPTHFILFLLDE